MSCPAESQTLDKAEEKTSKYNIYASNVREYFSRTGIKILKAVKLYSQKGERKEKNDKTRMKLESLLRQSVSGSNFIDSAWGCDCDKEKHCSSDEGSSCFCQYEYYCKCDSHDSCECHCKLE